MPSGATSEPPQPPLLLLRQRLAALGLLQLGEEDGGRGEAREDEEEEDDSDAASPPLLLGPEGEGRPRAVMAAMLGRAYGEASAGSGGEEEKLRRKSVNSTECVAVPSSEHVAEIVGRQGCKIKALRAKTNTYIKTPVRGEPPVFVVTGRSEDVAAARREILSAAEHFSLLRAWRGRAGPSCVPALPGHTTAHVRVPYRVVGLVVGPRGATIKRIQQQTHTYIVTPSRDREPVFEVTGMPENVERARQEIEMHIALRTGGCTQLGHHHHHHEFHTNSTDLGSESSPARARTASGHRNGSSSSLGSASTDSFFGSSHLADLSPTSPFGHGAFWFGEALPAVGTEEPALDSPLLDSPLLDSPLLDSPLLDSPLLDSPLLDSPLLDTPLLDTPLLDTPLLDTPLLDTPLLDTPLLDSLPTPSQPLWAPLEPVATPPGSARPPRHGSQPPTPRLSPTVPEGPEQPPARRSDPPGSGQQPVCAPAFSSGTDSHSSSNSGSACSSPPESRHDCVLCVQGEAMAALLPCGHNLFCLQCADGICEQDSPACPVCHSAVTQAVHTHC